MNNRRQLFAALRKAPEDPGILSQIAASYFDERNYKKVYVYDRRAWLTNKKNAICLTNLAVDLGMMGWHEKAIILW